MTKSTPAQRLRRAREHAFPDRKMADICESFGWPYESYKKHEADDPRRKIDPDMVPKYAAAYGIAPEWLLWGVNPPNWDAAAPQNRAGTPMFRAVPKFSLEQVISMPQGYLKAARTAPEVFIDRGPDIGSKSFAIDVIDDSMLSRPAPTEDNFRRGDVTVFDPEKTPRPGDFVCAHVEGHAEAIFRKYRPIGMLRGFATYELAPLNLSDYAPITIGPDGPKARIIGVLVRHVRKYGRS